MGGLGSRRWLGDQPGNSQPDVVARHLDVEFDAGQTGDVVALALEALRDRHSICRRIDLLGLLLDVIKKAD